MKKRIHLIIAARPNIMKIAPLYHALLKTSWAEPVLVHTGQHYDANMSGSFFKELNLKEPDFNLNIGSGSHAYQTAHTMLAYEEICHVDKPDLTIVVGDVNGTIACAMTAKKLGISVGHIEAGLRSFDHSMPEELNRLATDSICDWLWSPTPDGTEQLIKEGVDPDKIEEVGNLMIDSFFLMEKRIRNGRYQEILGLKNKRYGIITFHRPSNVECPHRLKKLVEQIIDVASSLKLVFPVHPRTKKHLQENELYKPLEKCDNIIITEPQSYLNFMNLIVGTKIVITDSGGLQEETSYLGIPCLTVRENTERPITLVLGTNQLVSIEKIRPAFDALLKKKPLQRSDIPKWDGKAAGRVVSHLKDKVFLIDFPKQVFCA